MGDPVKDSAVEVPVPEEWRPIISAIADSLVRRDPILGAGLASVDPVPAHVRKHCLDAVDDYGDATLVSLPDAAWDTSVALWLGDRWRCLVDLWTQQEGRSDLVLELEVFENGPGYRFCVHMLYVP